MRMSCNGCRILRKGCSENCSIRPCLMWIKSPESQANATVFLAKFYGRAGLMNLINAGPDHLRPAIFRSLLYEACGRILNPIYGSVGLLWSGTWHLCQAAVEAVLQGVPITPITSEAAANSHGPPLKAYDIRHVSKDENSAASNDHKKTRTRFKRTVIKPKVRKAALGDSANPKWAGYCTLPEDPNRSTSHESSVSHQSEAPNFDGESKETESMISVETAEPELTRKLDEPVRENEPALELTLGFEPASRACHLVPVKKRRIEAFGCGGGATFDDGVCRTELKLDYQA
ncbi:hypothetical protein UlMin_014393 [Ulmus minor]